LIWGSAAPVNGFEVLGMPSKICHPLAFAELGQPYPQIRTLASELGPHPPPGLESSPKVIRLEADPWLLSL